MSPYNGVGVALITPFTSENTIDVEAINNIVDHILAGGVDFIVALGTTAETPTLSPDERAIVVRTVSQRVAKRVPIVVGLGGFSTQEVIDQLTHLEWLFCCDAILSVVPFYNKPNQAGMYNHFSSIAQATKLPILLYNVPSRTGANLLPATAARLAAEFPNIIGIKEASGNFGQAGQLAALRDSFSLLSGDDSLLLPLMSIGFHGVISVAANVIPHTFRDLVDAVNAGNLAEAQRIHQQILPLCEALFSEGNPAGIKAALYHKGLIKCNKLRLPLVPVGNETSRKIKSIIENF